MWYPSCCVCKIAKYWRQLMRGKPNLFDERYNKTLLPSTKELHGKTINKRLPFLQSLQWATGQGSNIHSLQSSYLEYFNVNPAIFLALSAWVAIVYSSVYLFALNRWANHGVFCLYNKIDIKMFKENHEDNLSYNCVIMTALVSIQFHFFICFLIYLRTPLPMYALICSSI